MADVTMDPANQALITIVTAGKRTKTGTGGETMVAGDVVYLDSATGKYKKAANGDSATAVIAGVLLAPSADGKHCVFAYEDGTELAIGSSATENTWYTVSSTAGNIHPVADLASDEYLSWLGYGNGTNLILRIINTGTTKS